VPIIPGTPGPIEAPDEALKFAREIGFPVIIKAAAGGRLVSHDADLLRGRPDERDVRRHARLGEFRVLGQESVAGVDGVGASYLRGGDDARDVEVRFARGRGADADVVVGEADVERLAIGFGVHGDGLDAELAAGADHSQSDLAPVCNQDFLKHFVLKVSLYLTGSF